MDTLAWVAIVVGACGVSLALIVGVGYLAYRRQERARREHLTRLKQERPNATREQFVAWFTERGVRQSVAGEVYDLLQRRYAVAGFPFAPDDPLERVSDIVNQEESDDIQRELEKTGGVRTPASSKRACCSAAWVVPWPQGRRRSCRCRDDLRARHTLNGAGHRAVALASIGAQGN